MQSARILSFILFFLTFGFLVSGTPVAGTSELAKRCNCSPGETTTIDTLVQLQIDVNAELALLGEYLGV